MTDVFDETKRSKFIVIETAMIDITDGNLIILTDIEYWNDRYEELQAWCAEHEAEVRGMTVTCSDEALILFCLRW